MTFRITPARMTMAASSLIAVSALAACGTSGSDSAANLQLKPSTSTTSSSSAAAPTSSAAPSSATPSTTTSSKPAAKPTTKATKPASRGEARPATTTRTVTDTKTLYFSTVKEYDSTLAKGTSKVTTAGQSGSAKLTIKQTLVGGKVVKSVTVDRDVIKAPVNKVITIGTKKAVAAPAPATTGSTSGGSSSGAGLNLARAAMWDRIAWCESGQRWGLVASNSTGTYYGGLMMTRDAWRIGGGLKFASVASGASRAEQITVANNLYAQLGLKPWSCRGAA
ncbi:surface rod structure-forming protein G [Branchiibius hedensis]|uniref:G5 domain-containing protein n=1 Tax=Branchiibius hedensis TaxID=672460 RepID=A0A2Y8ZXY9_9MICO|nr:resuscitation-promoting factor [Branchiibius hedensis]PWJ26337.1 surface rod structure-forming protein G [Branchiibius hedensis]SSA35149.1 G5 domain-containing protein [Branchiibius hedensis]